MFSWRMLSILPLLSIYVNNLSTYFICFLPGNSIYIKQFHLFFCILVYEWMFLREFI